jgi:hypothetical protein
MWLVALMRMKKTDARFRSVENLNTTFTNGTAYASALRHQIDTYLWNTIPKGIETSKALERWNSSLVLLAQGFDSLQLNKANQTAKDLVSTSINTADNMAIQTMFDSLAITVAKDGKKPDEVTPRPLNSVFDKAELLQRYENRFELVFDYVFLSVSFYPPSPSFPFLSPSPP